MSIEVRSAQQRFLTQAEGRTTWHSFSFGSHYDPTNVGFAQLVALNDEHLPVGNGYAPHPHRGIEIVSVVLDGALEHRSDVGSGILPAGSVQRLAAGSGVIHVELNAAAQPTRFLQAWVTSPEPNEQPKYDAAATGDLEGWSLIAGGAQALLPIGVAMEMWLAKLRIGQSSCLPDRREMLLYVATGAISMGRIRVAAGDQLRLLDEAQHEITATAAETTLVLWVAR